MYQVIVPLTAEDVPTFLVNCKYIAKHLPCKELIVIGSDRAGELVRNVTQSEDAVPIHFVNEDEIYEGMNLQAVKNAIQEITGRTERAGWYFQQFIKMAYAYRCQDAHYVSWDADTIPLRAIQFEDADGKLLFTVKDEYNKPYFDTMEKLLGLKRETDASFIAEHMIFDKAIMQELIERINANQSLAGNSFFEKILHAIDKEEVLKSGFSEFELYGNYVMTYHKDAYSTRQMSSYRSGRTMFGDCIDDAKIQWVGNRFDVLSVEKWQQRTKVGKLSDYGWFRKWVPFKYALKLNHFELSRKEKVQRQK